MSEVDRSGRARLRRGAGPLLSLMACLAAAEWASTPAAGGTAAPPDPGAAIPGLPARRSAGPTPGAASDAEPVRGAFETALRSRLAREARRQRIDRPFAPVSAVPFDEEDDAAADGGRRAGRAILRSLRGALDDRLQTAARESGSFATLFRFLDARGASPPRAGDVAAAIPGRPVAAPAPGADFGVRLRIDAHPRLLLAGRVGRLEGRIELPILEREVRMTVEHPIGGFGGAALRGGRSDDRGTWADLALTLRF